MPSSCGNFSRTNERCLSALEEDQIIGYIGMCRIMDEGYITILAVHPDFRRRGIGGRLIKTLSNLAVARGLRRMSPDVRASNRPAQKLYESIGFKPAGLHSQYYQDNLDRVTRRCHIIEHTGESYRFRESLRRKITEIGV